MDWKRQERNWLDSRRAREMNILFIALRMDALFKQRQPPADDLRADLLQSAPHQDEVIRNLTDSLRASAIVYPPLLMRESAERRARRLQNS